MQILGIDIGGSGIKGAPVDTITGTMLTERHRIPTPQPSKPSDVADVVAEITRHFNWTGPVGCTFPAIVKEGVVHSAANVDKEWIGTNSQALFQERADCPFVVVNDADAAGIAEMEFGAGVGHTGVVIMLTFGTGIGSALFVNRILVPNTELGHLEIRGKDAEHRASDRIRQERDLSWEKWAEKVNEYLHYVEFLFSPDLFIIGGGVSKKHDRFLPLLDIRTPAIPAQMLNDAGIVGAAISARVLV
ncbi:MAG: ROK family protein [Anaerolineae bacterium]|nr:ROK family protein [Anaerolineae bacterium]